MEMNLLMGRHWKILEDIGHWTEDIGRHRGLIQSCESQSAKRVASNKADSRQLTRIP